MTKAFLEGERLTTAGRTKAQRLSDLPIIAALHLQARTPPEIAEYLSDIRPYTIQAESVRQDLVVIRKEWMTSAVNDFALAKAEELQKIGKLENAAWTAWERSWQETRQHETENSEEDVMSIDGEGIPIPSKLKKTREKTVTANRMGLTSYLQTIQWCIEKRCRIYGFDAPKQLEVTWRKEMESLGLRPDDIIDGLAREMEIKMLEPGT